MKINKYTAEKPESVYNFLKYEKNYSVKLIRKLKRTGGILVNGTAAKTIDMLSPGDEIRILLEDTDSRAQPNFSLKVFACYRDEDVVVYDKPAGMPVHESLRHRGDTLANVYAAEEGGVFRPVNRLDKDTTGLCVAAKNPYAAARLSGSVNKVYIAVCEGIIDAPGKVDMPIKRESESIIKRIAAEDGSRAVTVYEPLYTNGSYTLLKCILLTGRTHQIRVHMSYIGHPLAGDDMYGGKTDVIGRQALHCAEISFVHPVGGGRIAVKSEIPDDMKGIFK